MGAGEAEHLWDGGARDVGVQDADLGATAGELGGEDARDERLAHAALARDHADHVLDRAALGEGLDLGRSGLLLRGSLLLLGALLARALELLADALLLGFVHGHGYLFLTLICNL